MIFSSLDSLQKPSINYTHRKYFPCELSIADPKIWIWRFLSHCFHCFSASVIDYFIRIYISNELDLKSIRSYHIF